jgi:hypothetical protein
MEGEDNIALDIKDVPPKVTASSILFWVDALALQNISEQVIFLEPNSQSGKNRPSCGDYQGQLFQRRLFPLRLR